MDRTAPRGWAVILLFRAQQSSVILVSYTFGLFLPFIREDLGITALQAGLLQAVWWITAAGLSLPFGAWFSRFRPVPLALVSLVLGAPFLFVQALAPGFWVLCWDVSASYSPTRSTPPPAPCCSGSGARHTSMR